MDKIALEFYVPNELSEEVWDYTASKSQITIENLNVGLYFGRFIPPYHIRLSIVHSSYGFLTIKEIDYINHKLIFNKSIEYPNAIESLNVSDTFLKQLANYSEETILRYA